jgi:hypothetical protein
MIINEVIGLDSSELVTGSNSTVTDFYLNCYRCKREEQVDKARYHAFREEFEEKGRAFHICTSCIEADPTNKRIREIMETASKGIVNAIKKYSTHN